MLWLAECVYFMKQELSDRRSNMGGVVGGGGGGKSQNVSVLVCGMRRVLSRRKSEAVLKKARLYINRAVSEKKECQRVDNL